MNMKAVALGAWAGALAMGGYGRRTGDFIRGVPKTKYRKWQRKNRKKPMHSRARG